MKASPEFPPPGTKTYRLGACELDEARRSLCAQGREIPLQPRVFEVLRYLVQHRERVVSKEELLAALWPHSVVVDNALQRTVSLARAALAEAGLGQAVRTYSRHGYRFCREDCSEHSPGDPTAMQALAQAHAACSRYDWTAACEAFTKADAQGLLALDEIEPWGRAAICAGMGTTVLTPLERAVARRVEVGDLIGAARAALLLVQIRIDRMEPALAAGLLRRTARYLDGLPPGAEHGHFAWMSSRLALMLSDVPAALRHADAACALGRALRDVDVECLGLSYRGHALMAQGDFDTGTAQHEEAAAAISLGGVTLWVGGFVYCSVISASRNRCDWLRAAQWTQAFSEWCRTSSMPAFPGTCQLHRAEVLSVRGQLDEAAAEVGKAATLLAQVAPWAEGDAHRVLGDIRLTCGDLAGAEAAFRQAHALGWDPQPGLARLQMANGQPHLALRGLERALADGDWALRERRGQILCTLVHAALAAGDVERARAAIQALNADPHLLSAQALKAMALRAQAELAWEEHRRADALQDLKQAARHWHAVGSPPGEAETRLRLAHCLLEEGDPVAAEMELHAVELIPVLASVVGLRRRVEALRAAVRC